MFPGYKIMYHYVPVFELFSTSLLVIATGRGRGRKRSNCTEVKA